MGMSIIIYQVNLGNYLSANKFLTLVHRLSKLVITIISTREWFRCALSGNRGKLLLNYATASTSRSTVYRLFKSQHIILSYITEETTDTKVDPEHQHYPQKQCITHKIGTVLKYCAQVNTGSANFNLPFQCHCASVVIQQQRRTLYMNFGFHDTCTK